MASAKELKRRIKNNARIDNKRNQVFIQIPRGTYNTLLDLLELDASRESAANSFLEWLDQGGET